MVRRFGNRTMVTVGVVGALGVGATFGIASIAGASGHPAHGRTHASAAAVTTAAFTFDVTVSGLTPTPVDVTGSGQVDFTHDAVGLTVDLPAAVAKLIPGGSASPEVVDVVESGGTVYLQVPSLAGLLGKPWISLALPAKADAGGAKLFKLAATALGNVNAITGFATAHHATVTALPSGTVDGVQVTGDTIVSSFSVKGTPRTVTAKVYADSSGRLVQGDLSTSGVNATVDVTGYGQPVTVTVPPASAVAPIPLSVVASFLGASVHGGHRH